MDEIDRDNPKDVVSCRLEMLSTWLKSDTADPVVELDAALDDLQRKVHGKKHYELDQFCLTLNHHFSLLPSFPMCLSPFTSYR